MKNLRNSFERFCYRNRTKGIPNLMLYIMLANVLVYIMSLATGSYTLYQALCFDRSLILQGQVWRLLSYVLIGVFSPGTSILIVLLLSLCYFSLGKAIENAWGTFRFNLFYLTGIILMDIYAMIFNCTADPYYLNLSLLLSYCTLYPDARFLIFYIIPIRAWILALIDLALILVGLFIDPFPVKLFPLVALSNYFLFFGKDILRLIPYSWQVKLSRSGKKAKPQSQRPIQFHTAESKEAPKQKVSYMHRCAVCGKTDVSHPDMEFRYCSRCNGYYCYCQEHISNHTHIE